MSPARLLAALLAVASLAGARALQDVEFSNAGGQRLLLDAYIPDGAGPFPAAILVHGGAWVTGDKRGTVRPLFDPLAQASFAWFSINYRLLAARDPAALLSPSSVAALAGAVEDVHAAAAFVRSRAADYNIDPRRLALIGESAGAHLVSMAALKSPPGAAPQAVVAFYGPSDLVALLESSGRIPAALRQAVSGSPAAAVLTAGLRDLSPRTWVRSDAPPFLLIHGTADALVPYQQSVEMCAALQAAGAACELFPVQGAGHGMLFWNRPGMNAYQQHMVAWLRANLR